MAREMARRGDRDAAIPLMHATLDRMVCEGQLLAWGVLATGVLVETQLGHGTDTDVAEAEAVTAKLAAAPLEDGSGIRGVWLSRLNALIADARGDLPTYRDYRDRYRKMANELGFEGHMQWAEEMP